MVQFGCPYAKNPHVMYGTLDEDAGLGSGPPDTTFKACNGKEHSRDEDGNIEDEFVKGGMSNLEGTLSMANSGEPDSGGSQVFINVKDNKHLDWDNGSSESAHRKLTFKFLALQHLFPNFPLTSSSSFAVRLPSTCSRIRKDCRRIRHREGN